MALANIVLEQMGTGVIAIEHTGLVSLYNHAAQEILGVPVDRVLRRSCASLAGDAEPMPAIAGALSRKRRATTNNRIRERNTNATPVTRPIRNFTIRPG